MMHEGSLAPLRQLPGLRHLSLHKALNLRNPDWPLQNLQLLTHLSALSSLDLGTTFLLSSLAPLQQWGGSLQKLAVDCWDSITCLQPLAPLTALSSLQLESTAQQAAGLTRVAPLRHLSQLRELTLSGLSGLADLAPLGDLALRRLRIECLPVSDLGFLEPLGGHLAELEVEDCRCIVSGVPALSSLTALLKLSLARCPGITELAPVSRMTSLLKLRVVRCGYTWALLRP
jgi:hypothetical protein